MKSTSFIALFSLCTFFLQAQTVTWDDGGAGDDWHDALNWDGDILPTTTDEVIINSTDIVSIFNGNVSVRKVVNSGSFTIHPSMMLTLDAPGEIALQNTSSTGDLINQGTIDVVNAGSYGIYMNNGSAFANEPGAIINCENIPSGTAIATNSNNTQLTNEGTINISNNINLGINITNSSEIDNKGGDINISSTGASFRVGGLLTNEGLIEVVSSGSHGFWIINGTLLNEASATLRVVSSSTNQISFAQNSLLDNYGTIDLLGNTQNFSFGMGLSSTSAQMINRASGNIMIKECTWDGIYIAQGSTVENSGDITISNNIGRNGIYNNSTFNNLTSGTVNISDTGTNGIYNNKPYNSNFDVEFKNDGTVNLISNIGDYGIDEGIAGTMFTNSSSGSISIDSTGDIGIYAPFKNYGILELKSGIGGKALAAFGKVLNQSCGKIISEKNIYDCLFINQGIIISQFSSGSITPNANFINQGLIEDLVGPTSIVGLNNSGYRATNISGMPSESDVTIAFDQGVDAFYYGAKILWFTDIARTNSAGIYLPLSNEWVPSSAAVGLSIFYLTIENTQGCSSDFMVTLDNAVVGSPGNNIQAVVPNGLWNDPATWDIGIVPRAGDDVVCTYSITVPSGYDAKAKSLYMDGDLEIQTNSSLIIYNSENEGIINKGEVEIDGRLVIFKSVFAGLKNNTITTINDCGELYLYEALEIGNFTNNGYFFQDYSGSNYALNTFTNNGVIEDFQNSFDGIAITNNEIAIRPVANSLVRGEPLVDALDIAKTANKYQISEEWYLDAAKATSVGIYNQTQNVWIPNENAVGASTFFMEINTIGSSCPVIMKVNFENPVLDCSNGTISLNDGFSDYYNTLSWDLNRLPNACDILIIPLVTDTLSIPSLLDFEFRSIDNGGSLTIPSGTNVLIPNSDFTSIKNSGGLVNNGTIDITNSGTDGIQNNDSGSTFLNNNSINITNPGGNGIVTSLGTFTNNTSADIYIYSAQTNGVWNSSTFNNYGNLQLVLGTVSILNHDHFYSEGLITCQSADNYSIFNTSSALFENIGSITSSGSTTLISFWNINGSKFYNEISGTFNSTGTTRSIFNSGAMSEIYNFGAITMNNNTLNFLNENSALFTNMLQGAITNNGGQHGLENKTGASFINNGEFNVNAMSSRGINNTSIFTNDTDGVLNIDDVQIGFYNSNVMTNKGNITIGPNVTLRHVSNTNMGVITCKNGSEMILEE